MGKKLIIQLMIKPNKFLCPNWENIHAISNFSKRAFLSYYIVLSL